VTSELLTVEGISKRFPGVRALHRVDLTVLPGEVHALVGENGSGKSTLVKIMAGEYQPDEGRIVLEGEPVSFRAPGAAIRAGVTAIAQELPLVPQVSVTENVLLGHLPRRRLRVDWRAAHRTVTAVLAELDLDVDPRTRAGTLPLDQQQLVSIARALHLQSKLVVFDEATSSLTEDEVQVLFRMVRRLKERGLGVVFISHRLREIYEVADRVTVLRDGEVVGGLPIAEADEPRLTAMMVGRPLLDYFHKRQIDPGPVVLELRGLRGQGMAHGLDLQLRRGEIVGLAGLVGSGRSELLATVFGLRPRAAGAVIVDGRPARIRGPVDAIRLGLAMVPEDRKRAGVVLPLSVRHNLALARYGKLLPPLVRPAEERAMVERLASRLAIKAPSLETPVRLLSGGNQQKVVLGKWMVVGPRVWLLDEPTRGVDVGAKAEIYRLMGELAASGMAILMSSSELSDLLGICDRVLVMFRGQLVAEFDRAEATEERVIYYATGQSVA
jgi:ABC-type sugar transport system ATPase subunit